MNLEKVHLRPLLAKDSERMLEWMQDENVTRHLRIRGNNLTVEDTLRFIKNSADESVNLHRAVVNEADIYMGTISLKEIDSEKMTAEYAIAMNSDAIGTGAAKTATAEILKIAKEMGLRVYLNVLEENQRAIRFYEKFGFTYENTTLEQINGEEKALRWYIWSES